MIEFVKLWLTNPLWFMAGSIFVFILAILILIVRDEI